MTSADLDPALSAIRETSRELVMKGVASFVEQHSCRDGRLYLLSSPVKNNCMSLELYVEDIGSTLFVYGGDFFVGSFDLSERDIPELIELTWAILQGFATVTVSRLGGKTVARSISWGDIQWSVPLSPLFAFLPLRENVLSYSRYE
ncbi:MAG: hypothetical protein QG608_1293 [Actinomycetota bacterium]|nr:hypothetical protein [Actinomycetota bacterium]